MGVYRFEDLRVWKAAKEQCAQVGALVKRPEFRRHLGLSNQMNAASLSVMLNIREGFLRRGDKEMLQFLRIAAGSNGEVRSCYYAAHDRSYIGDEEWSDFLRVNDSIGKMIRRFQQTLVEHTKDQGRAKDQRQTKDHERTKDPGRTKDQGRTKNQGRTRNEEPGTKD